MMCFCQLLRRKFRVFDRSYYHAVIHRAESGGAERNINIMISPARTMFCSTPPGKWRQDNGIKEWAFGLHEVEILRHCRGVSHCLLPHCPSPV